MLIYIIDLCLLYYLLIFKIELLLKIKIKFKLHKENIVFDQNERFGSNKYSKSNLNGRNYNNRTIICSYYPKSLFDKII